LELELNLGLRYSFCWFSISVLCR